jgi:hypothetical protein
MCLSLRSRICSGNTIGREDRASSFWDSQGIIMIDYHDQGHIINGTDELRRLCQEIVRKRRGKLTRGVLLLHDIAPAHKSQVAIAAAAYSGFDCDRGREGCCMIPHVLTYSNRVCNSLIIFLRLMLPRDHFVSPSPILLTRITNNF